MKKNIIVVVFYLCLVVIIVTSFCKNKNDSESEKITYSQVKQSDIKIKDDNETGTQKILHIKGDVSKNLSPFVYYTKADRYILDKCYINIYNELKKIQSKSGSDYFESIDSDSRYTKKDKKKNGKKITTYTIRLKEGIKTAAGTTITADDLMFNYYLRTDSSYEASDSVYKCNIAGLLNYQTGCDDSGRAKKIYDSKIKKPSAGIKNKIRTKIIYPEIKEAFEWTSSLYRDKTYSYITDKYPRTRDLFVYFFALDPKYKAKKKDAKKVIKQVAAQYGWDYKKLGKVTGKDYNAQVKRIALNEAGKKSASGKQRINGIIKIDSYTIQIQVYEKTSQKDLFDFYIVPLAKWGDVQYFDSNYKWGVKKTKAYEIIKKENVTGDETGGYVIEKKEPYELVER
ncbi:hypothetical protein KQI69_08620 [Eubacterium sp. MSJ-13]|uniref:hypothetical protein n=1 Tax=Eubacterium sp. MSJ-13 TaxID=2841513 RepID=UPI001C1280AF|nr:hypothetical protein [Eubacterium sp. MSJ-13]MBU5479266.1 hypothetical protein [Eubacterium sp. MSJ-13]